jgi:hypothetical protein
MQLPDWQFSFRGGAHPASVLALAASDLFIPPAVRRFEPPGPGLGEVSATVSRSGTAIKLSFPGAPPGTGPCEANYRVSALSSRHAVAFTITTVAAPVPPGQACPALAVLRTAVLHLERPLGARGARLGERRGRGSGHLRSLAADRQNLERSGLSQHDIVVRYQ